MIRVRCALVAVIMAAGILVACSPGPAQGGPDCGFAPGTTPTHVLYVSLENRSWSDVGGSQFGAMPYLHTLATQCRTFASNTEADTSQNSATQYVSWAIGHRSSRVRNDCSPSSSCSETGDNIFRQTRAKGIFGINYVEGPSSNCSAAGNAAKHIPDLYMWASADRQACTTQTQPLSKLDWTHLPQLAFVTPNLCNDGHDCSNATVDNWLRPRLQRVLTSPDYNAGKVLVILFWDEDAPKPNLYLSAATPAGVSTAPLTYLSDLHLTEDLLGLPRLGGSAPESRSLVLR